MYCLTGRRTAVAVVAAISLVFTAQGVTAPLAHANLNHVEVGNSSSPEETPAFLGGELHGVTTQTIYIEGYGEVSSTIDNDTGEVTSTYPDGSVEKNNIDDLAQALQAQVESATPEQVALLEALAQERVSKEDVCPYLVSAVGTLHTLTWAHALVLAAANPAIATLAAFGQGFF